MSPSQSITKSCMITLLIICSLIAGTAQAAMESKKMTVSLPLVKGWFNGNPVLYIQTDASDAGVAKAQGVNYVPQLKNAIKSKPGSVDDIFVVTNFTQGNIIPSAPKPTGPKNTNRDYTPLWQVTTVTWKDTSQAHTLKSEQDVMTAESKGLVNLAQTQIVVNCPVVFSPNGGILPDAKIQR